MALGVDVDVVSDAAATLHGCANAEEVLAQLRTQSLASVKERFNARGILRGENGSTKRYVVQVGITPLDAVVSLTATRLCCGLSAVSGDVVLPVPVGRILEDPLAGLAVRRDDQNIIGASRVLLLVRGTGTTTMEPIDGEKQLS